MPKILPPVCFCEYCGEKYFEFPKDGTRLINQEPGYIARNKHYRVCDKVPINAVKKSIGVGESVKKALGSNDANCPVCGMIMRANNVLRHCANKHAYMLSLCMRNDDKERSKKHKCPIVIAYKDGGDIDVLKVCLVCKKGYTDGSVNKESFADMRFDHKECCKEFDKYAELFEPCETLMDLPFEIHAAAKRKIRHVGSAAPEISFRETAVAVGGAGTALDDAEREELELLRRRADMFEKERDEWRKKAETARADAISDQTKELLKALSFAMTQEEDTTEEISDMIEWCKEHEEMIQTTLKNEKKPLQRKIAELEKKVADYESGREVARLKDRVRELEADRRDTAVFEGTLVKLGYKGKRIDSDSD